MTLFEEAARLEGENILFAVATIMSSRGSTPRNSGRMLIRRDGTTLGTVGGGPMEFYVIRQALEALASGESRRVSRDLIPQGKEAVGMQCGGTMEVFIDVINPRPKLMLIGGGHVNLALARAARLLNFEIILVEDREEFASPERFPMAVRIHRKDNLMDALGEAKIDGNTRVVIATKNEDFEVLKHVIATPAPYVGMLGSKRKVATAMDELRALGLDKGNLPRLHSPVGLNIGAETPGEIAVSILAEILKEDSRRGGTELRSLVHDLVVIRGAGDLATGVAVRLIRGGFPVVCLETAQPRVIRRAVAFAQAVFDGRTEVEGIQAQGAADLAEVYRFLEQGKTPVLIDPEAESLAALKPAVLVDAIMAKKNLGTTRDMAPVTIALGPGFKAGMEVDAVIETARGHNLGRVILAGSAAANTGIPGKIGGETIRRILRAPGRGNFKPLVSLGTLVSQGEAVAEIDGQPVVSPLGGMVRGLLAEGLEVCEGMKVGDIDPRGTEIDPRTISDKARSLGGAVLEAILYLRGKAQ